MIKPMIPWWTLIIFLGSVISNFFATLYIWKEHNINGRLFLTLFLNTSTTSISSLVIFLVLAMGIENDFLCSCLATSLMTTAISTPVLNFMSGFVRYIITYNYFLTMHLATIAIEVICVFSRILHSIMTLDVPKRLPDCYCEKIQLQVFFHFLSKISQICI